MPLEHIYTEILIIVYHFKYLKANKLATTGNKILNMNSQYTIYSNNPQQH